MKEIRDPVHNFIYFTEAEMKIVNTLVFQRLRYIRQLAFTNFVYPGAEHSRFAHSMGVMESRALGFSWTPNCDENE
jgi:HD superfamily phosphohydrolase